MSEIDQLMAQVPPTEIADELGVDEEQAATASRTALEALLGGLQANAADPAGAASLARALGEHDDDLLGSDLSDVDTADGQRIVENIFGAQTDGVIAQLGGVRGSGGSSLIAKLLPILAPIVLSYLAKRLGAQGGLGSILGQVLGGAAGSASGSSGGGGLGDILGQVLGGAAGGASTGAGSDTRAAAPEQPTGPLIPQDGSEPGDASADRGSDGSVSAGGALGDILGQILSGASGATGGTGGTGGTVSGQPNITDILGDLLGGGKR